MAWRGDVVRVLLVCGVACCVPLMGRSGFPVDLQKRGNGYEMRCGFRRQIKTIDSALYRHDGREGLKGG